jgi:pyruvate dehydrogenase E1 component alpha subunit
MVEKVIEKFEVKYLQVMDENGNVDSKLMPNISQSQIKKMYNFMVLARVFDDKALKLQRQGRMGTYAPMKGQEASQIGSIMCVKDEDMVFPAFREGGAYMARGMPPELIYQYWAGDERGSKMPTGVNMFPVSITVGAHMVHAVGAAMAYKIQKKKSVALTYFGDGATSEGDFHEAMNFAGVFQAPVVLICQNNQWAISLPVAEQTASKTLAQKAIAYGIEGVKVDGNDIFAIYKVTKDAIDKARSGKGPTLIESFTYRLADHTTSDDAKKYRKEAEVKGWEKKDPILRLEKYMTAKKMLDAAEKEKIWKDAKARIAKAVETFEGIPGYEPEYIFDFMYAELTPELKEQRAKIKQDNHEFFEKKIEEKTGGDGKKSSNVKEKGAGVVGELEEAA